VRAMRTRSLGVTMALGRLMTRRFCNGYRARHASHFSMIHVSASGRQLARPTCVPAHRIAGPGRVRGGGGEGNKRLQRIMKPLNNESSVGERINTHGGETARLRAFCCALCAAFTRWLSVPRHRSAFRFRIFSAYTTATAVQVHPIAGGSCAIMPRAASRPRN